MLNITNKKAWLTTVSIVIGLGLVAAACNHSSDESQISTAEVTTTTAAGATTTTAATTDNFGNAPWPCGPGNASGATDQGITDTEILIGGGNDRGFPTSAGLNQELTEAVEAFIEVCNEKGGINGRKVRQINYDAKIFETNNRMIEACDQVFMLVGSLFALDGLGEATRVECQLPAVPAATVSAEFAHGPNQISAIPNPSDQQVMSIASMFKNQVIPGQENIDITKSAGLFGNFAATQDTWDKVRIAYTAQYGFKFIVDREYNLNGEEDWTPWVKDLIDNGVEFVHFVGSCQNYQALRKQGVVQDLSPDVVWTVEANFYEDKCIAGNTDGAMDNTIVRMSFIPFEEADINPSTKQFIDIVEAAGYKKTLLGMQAVSSFLLWAKAAKDCGSNLTRLCVLDNLKLVNSWDGHGLHTETNPAGNQAINCGIALEMRGTEYVRVYPQERGTFACPGDPAFNEVTWKYELSDTAALKAAQVNEDRLSTKFLN